MKSKIKEILLVLDDYLGDSDPYIDPDWTDDDIREEYPILWTFQQLVLMEEIQ
jgi:hypothetical protein